MSAEKNTTVSATSGTEVVTLALVSSYIASVRPEGDRLGYYAEIAQAISVGSLLIGFVLLVIVLVLTFVAAVTR